MGWWVRLFVCLLVCLFTWLVGLLDGFGVLDGFGSFDFLFCWSFFACDFVCYILHPFLIVVVVFIIVAAVVIGGGDDWFCLSFV